MPRSGPSALALVGAVGTGCAIARTRGQSPLVGREHTHPNLDEPFVGLIKATVAGAHL